MIKSIRLTCEWEYHAATVRSTLHDQGFDAEIVGDTDVVVNNTMGEQSDEFVLRVAHALPNLSGI